MKRLLCVLLALVLLGSLVPPGKAEAAFRFTRDNFPRLDGSTSMVPLGNGIASVLLGESREDTTDLIHFNRTTQSFRNLCNGDSDIVIAAEPKNEVFQEMAQASFPYEMEQIATEALVFVVNEENPVSSLTASQVRDIYAGRITNWAQVGGEDLPIVAFQRNPSAGSQVMMEKLVMAGTPMMEAPATMVPQEMGELIQAVRGYDNSANAIGYTVFYYASDMQMAQGLKILKIDGVTPSADTLRSGQYPFLNGYYCCISALAPQDSPERMLFNWLVSDAGQQLLTLEGYVSVHAPGQAPSTGDGVATNYSAYTPNGGTSAKFTAFPCPKDHLDPRPDYGDLYPYEGVRLYGSWEGDIVDYRTGSLLGFFNHKGELITDPIYSTIVPLTTTGEDYLWVVYTPDEKCGYVARDGSFASPLCYETIYPLGDYLMAVMDSEAQTFQLLDRNLMPVATQEDYTFGGKRYMPSDIQKNLTVCHRLDEEWNSEYLVLDQNKNILLQTTDYVSLDANGILHRFDQNWNPSLYDSSLTPLELPEVGASRTVAELGNRFYLVSGDEGSYVLDANGSLFEWDYESVSFSCEDCFAVTKNGQATLYDPNGRVKYTGLNPDWYYEGQGIFSQWVGDGLLLHKLPENKSLSFPDASFAYSLGQCIQISVLTNDVWTTRLVDRELNLLPQSFGELSTLCDLITGEEYLLSYDPYGFAGEQRLLTPDGKTQLFQANGELGIQSGYITVSNDWAFSCYSPDGALVFCYPHYGMTAGD